MLKTYISASFVACLLTACQTTGPAFKLVLSNASDAEVSDVEILLDGKPAFQAPHLAAHEIRGNSRSFQGTAPKMSVIRWKAGGESYEKAFKPDKTLPANFQGHITLEFKAADKVLLFSQAGAASEDPEMPWSTPQEWEGAPSIPGLSGQ